MPVNRRKMKVSDRYGKSEGNYENKIVERMLNSEATFKEMYKSLSSEQKKKINYEEGIRQAQNLVNRAKATKFIDDDDMFIAKSSDKPMMVTEFLRKIKSNYNNNLVLIQNMMIGENVGGHSIMFMTNEGLEFVCGVGKSCDNVINPETEFQEVQDGMKKERKIKSRGYLAAYHSIEKWLRKHNKPVYRPNFMN